MLRAEASFLRRQPTERKMSLIPVPLYGQSSLHRWRANHLSSPCCSLDVVLCTQEMQRDVGFIPDHPTVVRQGRNIEEVAWLEFDHCPTLQCRRGSARHNHADVFNFTWGESPQWG